jgi:hypothetical protein
MPIAGIPGVERPSQRRPTQTLIDVVIIDDIALVIIRDKVEMTRWRVDKGDSGRQKNANDKALNDRLPIHAELSTEYRRLEQILSAMVAFEIEKLAEHGSLSVGARVYLGK